MQKAKVAKILLAVNRGVEIDLTDVKPDDEIIPDGERPDNTDPHRDDPLSPGDDAAEDEEEHRDEDPANQPELCVNQAAVHSSHTQQHTCKQSKTKKSSMHKEASSRSEPSKYRWQAWSADEISAVKRQLNHCLLLKKVPNKKDAEHAIALEPALKNRTLKSVKFCVYSMLKKKTKEKQLIVRGTFS